MDASIPHRTSCHRCGNIRKLLHRCVACPNVFCLCCAEKIISEDGPMVFDDGCPVCKDICCCGSNKSSDCQKEFHCYRKCLRLSPKSKKESSSTSRRSSDSRGSISSSATSDDEDSSGSNRRSRSLLYVNSTEAINLPCAAAEVTTSTRILRSTRASASNTSGEEPSSHTIMGGTWDGGEGDHTHFPLSLSSSSVSAIGAIGSGSSSLYFHEQELDDMELLDFMTDEDIRMLDDVDYATATAAVIRGGGGDAVGMGTLIHDTDAKGSRGSSDDDEENDAGEEEEVDLCRACTVVESQSRRPVEQTEGGEDDKTASGSSSSQSDVTIDLAPLSISRSFPMEEQSGADAVRGPFFSPGSDHNALQDDTVDEIGGNAWIHQFLSSPEDQEDNEGDNSHHSSKRGNDISSIGAINIVIPPLTQQDHHTPDAASHARAPGTRRRSDAKGTGTSKRSRNRCYDGLKISNALIRAKQNSSRRISAHLLTGSPSNAFIMQLSSRLLKGGLSPTLMKSQLIANAGVCRRSPRLLGNNEPASPVSSTGASTPTLQQQTEGEGEGGGAAGTGTAGTTTTSGGGGGMGSGGDVSPKGVADLPATQFFLQGSYPGQVTAGPSSPCCTGNEQQSSHALVSGQQHVQTPAVQEGAVASKEEAQQRQRQSGDNQPTEEDDDGDHDDRAAATTTASGTSNRSNRNNKRKLLHISTTSTMLPESLELDTDESQPQQDHINGLPSSLNLDEYLGSCMLTKDLAFSQEPSPFFTQDFLACAKAPPLTKLFQMLSVSSRFTRGSMRLSSETLSSPQPPLLPSRPFGYLRGENLPRPRIISESEDKHNREQLLRQQQQLQYQQRRRKISYQRTTTNPRFPNGPRSTATSAVAAAAAAASAAAIGAASAAAVAASSAGGQQVVPTCIVTPTGISPSDGCSNSNGNADTNVGDVSALKPVELQQYLNSGDRGVTGSLPENNIDAAGGGGVEAASWENAIGDLTGISGGGAVVVPLDLLPSTRTTTRRPRILAYVGIGNRRPRKKNKGEEESAATTTAVAEGGTIIPRSSSSDEVTVPTKFRTKEDTIRAAHAQRKRRLNVQEQQQQMPPVAKRVKRRQYAACANQYSEDTTSSSTVPASASAFHEPNDTVAQQSAPRPAQRARRAAANRVTTVSNTESQSRHSHNTRRRAAIGAEGLNSPGGPSPIVPSRLYDTYDEEFGDNLLRLLEFPLSYDDIEGGGSGSGMLLTAPPDELFAPLRTPSHHPAHHHLLFASDGSCGSTAGMMLGSSDTDRLLAPLLPPPGSANSYSVGASTHNHHLPTYSGSRMIYGATGGPQSSRISLRPHPYSVQGADAPWISPPGFNLFDDHSFYSSYEDHDSNEQQTLLDAQCTTDDDPFSLLAAVSASASASLAEEGNNSFSQHSNTSESWPPPSRESISELCALGGFSFSSQKVDHREEEEDEEEEEEEEEGGGDDDSAVDALCDRGGGGCLAPALSFPHSSSSSASPDYSSTTMDHDYGGQLSSSTPHHMHMLESGTSLAEQTAAALDDSSPDSQHADGPCNGVSSDSASDRNLAEQSEVAATFSGILLPVAWRGAADPAVLTDSPAVDDDDDDNVPEEGDNSAIVAAEVAAVPPARPLARALFTDSPAPALYYHQQQQQQGGYSQMTSALMLPPPDSHSSSNCSHHCYDDSSHCEPQALDPHPHPHIHTHLDHSDSLRSSLAADFTLRYTEANHCCIPAESRAASSTTFYHQQHQQQQKQHYCSYSAPAEHHQQGQLHQQQPPLYSQEHQDHNDQLQQQQYQYHQQQQEEGLKVEEEEQDPTMLREQEQQQGRDHGYGHEQEDNDNQEEEDEDADTDEDILLALLCTPTSDLISPYMSTASTDSVSSTGSNDSHSAADAGVCQDGPVSVSGSGSGSGSRSGTGSGSGWVSVCTDSSSGIDMLTSQGPTDMSVVDEGANSESP